MSAILRGAATMFGAAGADARHFNPQPRRRPSTHLPDRKHLPDAARPLLMKSEQTLVEVRYSTPSRAARWAIFALATLATAFIVPSHAHAATVSFDCPGSAPAGGQFVG